MKVCVYGLWHLGSVTAACLAGKGVQTTGLDPDAANIAALKQGQPPLFEGGLEDLVKSGLKSGKLDFTTSVRDAVADADIVWVAFDTPVDDEDRADVDYVKNRVTETFPFLRDGAVVLVSSQMPVGSIRALESAFAPVANGRKVHFACSPENLRLGKAIEIFLNPGRIIIGVRGTQARAALEPLLARICDQLIWISVESAEMTKHALNAFLATCVVFINEVSAVCEEVGADASEVEKAIRSDPRIGANTYVTPGAAFAGGTLARDVTFLNQLGVAHDLKLAMLGGIIPSNAEHRRWALRRLQQLVKPLDGAVIAVLGLSYKPGTSAIRRSIAIELCQGLAAAGAKIRAFDPEVKNLPAPLDHQVVLCGSAQEALRGAQAVVIATPWPAFRDLTADDFVAQMKQPLVLDQAGYLARTIGGDPQLTYVGVGTSL